MTTAAIASLSREDIIQGQWFAVRLFLAFYQDRPELALEDAQNRAALKHSTHCVAHASRPAPFRLHGTPLCEVCCLSVAAHIRAELRAQQLVQGGLE